jgi:hypothetical protein
MKRIENIYIFYIMGCWNVFCCICGNSCYQLDYYNEDEFLNVMSSKEHKELIKKSKWLKNATMLLQNNKVMNGCREVGCNVEFKAKDGKLYTAIEVGINALGTCDNIGIFIHTNCWKYVKIKYKVELKYSDIPLVVINKMYKVPINYGDITQYQSQYMDYVKMFQDNNIHMMTDPLKNDKMNNIRLKKIINQLKLKSTLRPSPSMSATFNKTNDIRMGNNGKFWIIKNNKWVEIKESIIKKTANIDYRKAKSSIIKEINGIPQIGEKNTKLIFINNFVLKKGIYEIQFIGSDENVNKLINKMKN